MFRKSAWPLLLVGLLPAVGAAQSTSNSAAEPDRFRVAGLLGIGSWADLGDMQPTLGGDFDETGFSAEGSFHARVTELGPMAILLGVDGGVVSFESSVAGSVEGEDLLATLVRLTPSVQFTFSRSGCSQFFVDAGFGYYDVSIEEWEDDCLWDCDVFEYYSDSTAGGYVGLGADVDVGEKGGFRIATDFKGHFVDFDDPLELDSVASLGGPIYQFHVGVAWSF